jgi:hypothetical protein
VTTTMTMEATDSDSSNGNDNNSSKEEAIAKFRSLVLTLASSRPDVLSPKNRNALIQSAQKFLIVSVSTASGKTLSDEDASKDNNKKDDNNDKDDDDDDKQDENNNENPQEVVLSKAEAREILANWKGTNERISDGVYHRH